MSDQIEKSNTEAVTASSSSEASTHSNNNGNELSTSVKDSTSLKNSSSATSNSPLQSSSRSNSSLANQIARKGSFYGLKKALNNPLDDERLNQHEECQPNKGDWLINKVYGLKVHDKSTWPEYLKKQNVSPNDVRQGFSRNCQHYLPNILHNSIDPQYLGDFDYHTLDIGTTYLCDPTPTSIIASYDGYYSFQPETLKDGGCYAGTILEDLIQD